MEGSKAGQPEKVVNLAEATKRQNKPLTELTYPADLEAQKLGWITDLILNFLEVTSKRKTC